MNSAWKSSWRIICCLNLSFNGETLWEGHWELRLPWESILVGNQRDSFQRTVHSTTVQLGAFWILVPDLYPYTVNVHLFKWGSICLCKNVVLGHQNWWCLHVYCTREVHPKINVCLYKIRKDVMTALWFWPRSFFPAPDLFCLKWLKWFFRKLLGNYWILTDLPVTNLHLEIK